MMSLEQKKSVRMRQGCVQLVGGSELLLLLILTVLRVLLGVGGTPAVCCCAEVKTEVFDGGRMW